MDVPEGLKAGSSNRKNGDGFQVLGPGSQVIIKFTGLNVGDWKLGLITTD